MKIEQTYLDDHQLEVTVEAEQDVFEKAKRQAAKELSKRKSIPGFRPGKAPYQRILSHFGEAAIVDQALEHFLDDVYPQIIEEIKQEPYGPGSVKEIKSLEPPVFIFHIPLQPEVTLGDYRKLRLEFEKSDVDGDEVQKIIDRMLAQQASVETVDHPAEEKNLIDTSLDARSSDSDPENEESYLLKNQPLPVMIKSKDEDDSREWPFPGFSRQLLGVSSGDKLELSHVFSDEESVDEDYRGKEVLYTVQIEGIRERVLPELNDEFVKTVSDLETVEELNEEILGELSAQKEMEDENTYVNKILDAILDDSEVKYPPQMLENEIEGEVRELESRLRAQGMDLEMYLNIQNLDEEALREQIKPNAERRINHGLVIGKISEAEDLDIKPEDITGEFQSLLDDHFGDDDKGRAEYMKSQDSVVLLNRISSQVITRKTLDFLKAVARGEDITEFLKKDEQTDPEATEAEIPEAGGGEPSEPESDQSQQSADADQSVEDVDQAGDPSAEEK